jgi:AAA ATPase-like protein
VPHLADPSIAGVPTGQYPLIGRDREMAALEALLSAGRSALAVVSGPLGSGKSKLVREFAERARSAGWDVLSHELRSDMAVDDMTRWSGGGRRRLVLIIDGWRRGERLLDWLRAELGSRPELVAVIADEEATVAELRDIASVWLELAPISSSVIEDHLSSASAGIDPPLAAPEMAIYVTQIQERPELLGPLVRVLHEAAVASAELGSPP